MAGKQLERVGDIDSVGEYRTEIEGLLLKSGYHLWNNYILAEKKENYV